jgi:Protein of unknown function, DUF547
MSWFSRLGWQSWLFALIEILLYLSYQHHDARFHWFLHFFVGTSTALIVLVVLTYYVNRTIDLPMLWLLMGHAIAMLPDILWNFQLLPHQPWMDVFLFHVSSHFIPGRNWTWYVIFLICLAAYFYARRATELRAKESVSAWVWIVLFTGMIGTGCSSVPKRFTPSNPIDPAQVSHQMLNDVLQTHVRDGFVNYPEIQSDQRFAAYLALLDRVNPSALPSERDQLTFWINAYNACAIEGILDGYSPKPYIGWYRFFKMRTNGIGGVPLSLSDLEHEILRKQFHEPRIHFAIVCASSSCPKLPSWAYDATQLDQQLDLAARAFINDPTRNRFDRQQRTAFLSKIFDWFEDDFVMRAGSVPQFVAHYVDDADLARDLAGGLLRIAYLDYDWSLNGLPLKETARASEH